MKPSAFRSKKVAVAVGCVSLVLAASLPKASWAAEESALEKYRRESNDAVNAAVTERQGRLDGASREVGDAGKRYIDASESLKTAEAEYVANQKRLDDLEREKVKKERELDELLVRFATEGDAVAKDPEVQAYRAKGAIAQMFSPKPEALRRLESYEKSVLEDQKKAQAKLDEIQKKSDEAKALSESIRQKKDWAKKQTEDLQRSVDNQDKVTKTTPDVDKKKIALDKAKDFYARQVQQGFDAKLLMMDFSLLEKDAKLHKTQVDALKQQIDGQINNTLLGEYINKQIKKSAQAPDCNAVKACSDGGGKVSRDLDAILRAPLVDSAGSLNGSAVKAAN